MSEVKKSVFAPFLLVMLILSSIIVAIMVISLVVIIVEMVSAIARGNSYGGVDEWVVNGVQAVINIGSIVALALLWMRRKEGIILKFGLLGLSVVHGIFGAISRTGFGTFGGLSDSTVSLLTVIIGIVVLVWNGGIATLWYFAWRAQERHDGIDKFLGTNKLD